MIREKLNKILKDNGIDAIISEAPQTRLWYAGVQTSDGFLVIEKEKAYLFVDGRYIEYVTKNSKNVEVVLLKGTSFKDFWLKRNMQLLVLKRTI